MIVQTKSIKVTHVLSEKKLIKEIEEKEKEGEGDRKIKESKVDH